MATKIKLRRGLAERWTSVNPILSEGEMGIETDTQKFKFGDGTTTWSLLPYASSGSSGDIPTKLSQLENDEGFIDIEDVETAGYTKNVGTVTSVNNVEPVDGNVSIDIPSEVTESTVSDWDLLRMLVQ